jgi:sugar lactone lactonase YvrE
MRKISTTTVALALTILVLVGPTRAAQLDQCDMVVADSWGTVYLFRPRTGERVIIGQWGKLDRPYKLIRDRKGNIVVSDTGTLSLVHINSATKEQTVIAEDPQRLGVPYSFDIDDEHNRIFLVNGVKLFSIDLDSHEIETVAEGGFLQAPLDVVIAPGGVLYIADALAGIIRIDPVTRKQTLISRGGFLRTPLGLALDNNNRTLYVADPGGSCIIAIDLRDISQRMVSQGGLLITPVALALGPGGTLLCSDPDGSNLAGAIIAVERDGVQTPVMQGFGDLVNPRGIAIVIGH